MINKILNFIKNNYILLLILIFAIYLRFTGINPGYPAHTDEGGYSSALTMIWNENLDPGRYDYPAGVPLIHIFLFKSIFIPLAWFKYYVSHLGQILDGFINIPLNEVDYQRIFRLEILGNREINVMYWGRYVTAFFGVGVVISSYLFSKKVFNKSVGLITAFLVAVNFRQVLNSHIGLPDIYNAFFLLLTLYYSYSIILNPITYNYFMAGLFNAIYFSIKFQTFGFLPLLVSHLIVFKRITDHFKLFLTFLTSTFFIILLNPYLFIKFEQFKAIQTYQLAKYGIGSNSINIFPISYLYHIGIGNVISILFVIGVVYCLFRYFKKSVLIVLVLVQFMFVFVYMSRGGFYTRNFVTITPIILIFSAVIISGLFKAIKIKWLSNLTLLIFLILISLDNIKNSSLIAREYNKPWNRLILGDWVNKNIPQNSKVAAHSDTPLPDNVKRLMYEPDISFSINEFIENNADYAISNSSWTTNSFYWWMGGPFDEARKHLWDKPVEVLEYSYPALALRELEQFNVFAISNPWQAPDTDFLIAKIPKYSISSKKLVNTFNFDDNIDGWRKSGIFWADSDNLDHENGTLIVVQEPAKLPSIRWESPILDIKNWKGFAISYDIKTENNLKNVANGYVFVSFYGEVDDAKNSINRTGIRLSERNTTTDKWVKKELVGTIPQNSKYMTINFASYSPTLSKTMIDNINIYDTDVKIDLSGVKITPIRVDQNNLFLNSHGNL